MANNIVKEIKVGNTIYEIKDKKAVNEIKIGDVTIRPNENGVLELPPSYGGGSGEDSWLRGKVYELIYQYLAPLAFENGRGPAMDYDVHQYNVTVDTENLLYCLVLSYPETITENSSVSIEIKADLNYEFEENAITMQNIEVEEGSLRVSSITRLSDNLYRINFSLVKGDINIKIKNVEAIPTGEEKVSITWVSNSSWTCNKTLALLESLDLDSSITLIFETANNFAFGETGAITVTMQNSNNLREIVIDRKNRNKIEVTITDLTGNTYIEVNTLYVYNISYSTLHCSFTNPPSEIVGEVETLVLLNVDSNCTATALNVNPTNCGSFAATGEENQYMLTLTPRGNKAITVTAHAEENLQELSESTKVVLKLLNITPDNNAGFGVPDETFGYYTKLADNSVDLEVILTPISYTNPENELKTAVSNEDLVILGIDSDDEATTLTEDTDYEFSDQVENQLIIKKEALNLYKEVIVTATAHKDYITVVCLDTITNATTQTITLKYNGTGTNNTYNLVPGNNYIYPGDNVTYISKIGRNYDTINHLTHMQTYLQKIDFGGYKFSTELDHFQLFNSNSNLGHSQLKEVRGLVVKSVPTLNSWFLYADVLEKLDTIGWDLSNTTAIASTFTQCSLNLESNKKLALDLDYMNVENVTKVGKPRYTGASALFGLFENANLKELRVRGWKLNQVKDAVGISLEYMFYGVPLEKIDLSTWRVKNLTSLYRTFNTCNNLKELDISGIETNKTGEYMLSDMQYAFAVSSTASTGITNVSIGNLHVSENLNTTDIVVSNKKIGKIDLKGNEVLQLNTNDPENGNWIRKAANGISGNTLYYPGQSIKTFSTPQ